MTEAYENSLRLARAAKAKRKGSCRVCGAETHYAGKPGKPVSDLCPQHAAEARALKVRGSGELNSRILAYLTEPRRYSDIRAHVGITGNHLSPTLDRLLRYGLIERVERGVYVRVK